MVFDVGTVRRGDELVKTFMTVLKSLKRFKNDGLTTNADVADKLIDVHFTRRFVDFCCNVDNEKVVIIGFVCSSLSPFLLARKADGILERHGRLFRRPWRHIRH